MIGYYEPKEPPVEECLRCGGTGEVDGVECVECYGTGMVTVEEPDDPVDRAE